MLKTTTLKCSPTDWIDVVYVTEDTNPDAKTVLELLEEKLKATLEKIAKTEADLIEHRAHGDHASARKAANRVARYRRDVKDYRHALPIKR